MPIFERRQSRTIQPRPAPGPGIQRKPTHCRARRQRLRTPHKPLKEKPKVKKAAKKSKTQAKK
jgi:hypothetical protein